MKFEVESVSISKIDTGERRREKTGSLAALKSSLERVGQIHPITVRVAGDRYELVAGERRLEAARALGWTRIRARIGKFTDDQLREIELDENQVRLDLTPFEASKEKLRQIEKDARAVMADKNVSRKKGQPPGPAHILSGGDKKKRAALQQEISRTKKHVQAAEEHPAFQGQGWKRSQVLAASEALDGLPKRDQRVAVEMVTEPGVDTKSAVKMLETLSEKPAPERKAIFDLYKSDDPQKKSLAKTRAAKLPPLPPPILGDLDQAVRWLEKASTRETPRSSKYHDLAEKARSLREAEEKDYERLKAAEE